ncbi:hypothetical protein ABE021_04340 [Sporosarcina gallistercoris]
MQTKLAALRLDSILLVVGFIASFFLMKATAQIGAHKETVKT